MHAANRRQYITSKSTAMFCCRHNLPVYFERAGQYTLEGLIETENDCDFSGSKFTVKRIHVKDTNATFEGVLVSAIQRNTVLFFDHSQLYFINK